VNRGGTFGVETLLDPYYTKSDKLSVKVLGYPGKLPPMLDELNMEIHLLDKVIGSQDELEVKPLQKGEDLMLNVGTSTSVGTVSRGKKDLYTFKLKRSVCARKGGRVTLARRFGTRWRLVGYGVIQ
jgi:translation initiation factor 2 subunit 3